MIITEPTNVEELQNELITNCQEIISDTFLLECLIAYSRKQFSTNGQYSAEDCGLALRRVVSYIEQHSKDIVTISSAITGLLCKEAFQNAPESAGNKV